METMSPQQESTGQSRSASLTGEVKVCALPENKKKMKSLTQRRQSAPSLVISKALTRTRTISREACLSPISPEACPLVQSFLGGSRLFIAHGHVQMKTGLQTQERHLFLFNDILLVTKAKSSTHFKLKAQVRVSEMWTASCMEEVCEGSTSAERSFVMGWPISNCVATFSSTEQKDRWLHLIQSQIREEKEKDEPKTVPLKIFMKDTESCAYSKTLQVSNSDSATEVIRMALQQFGISTSVRDYRLWVISCKDAAPYPLIGHEFPFSIKMSHIREPSSHVAGKEAASPAGQQGVGLSGRPPLDSQCQFILKPSHAAEGHSLMDPLSKTFKRKRSLLNWAFWKGSTTHLDGPPPSPTSPQPGMLFGLPLSAVCQGDTLPKPIMDMLDVLFHHGPYTRGIFRRSASAKACRELRDKLDSGAQDIQLEHEAIFVIAAVFKEFLRNIPGSLLCQDLYNQWVGVLDAAGEGEEERVQATQRLVQRLPVEHQLLLRHVLTVLHCVDRHSDDNQMNAFNLSVCIAPSMLWAPAPSSPEIEGGYTKKVSEVVCFLIENHAKVLRDDGTAHFREFPQKRGSSDQGSDVSSFQMNDSSYDSLENELNDDTESAFQDLRRRRDKQDNWSRDSVITLSDCDLDQPDARPDPEPDLLQLPPLAHSRKFIPAIRQPHPRPHPYGDMTGQDLLCPPGSGRRLRRSSEPNIRHPPACLPGFPQEHSPVIRKASYDAVTADTKKEEGEEEDEEVFVGHICSLNLNSQMEPENIQDVQKDRNQDRKTTQSTAGRKHKQPPPLRLDASCSSLSSPATSPSASSMSSLDSAFSQYSTDYAVFTPNESCGSSHGAQGSTSPYSPPFTSSSTPCPATSSPTPSSQFSVTVPVLPIAQPKETSDWVQHRTAHGLHPNTWLKRDSRLSLLQKDRVSQESAKEKEPSGSPSTGLHSRPAGACTGQDETNDKRDRKRSQNHGGLSKRRSSCPPTYQQAILQIQKLPFFQAKDKTPTVKEPQQLHGQASVHRLPVGSDSTGSAETCSNMAASGSDCSQPPQAVFFGQSQSCVTLRKWPTHPLSPPTAFPRRASEPSVVLSSSQEEPTHRSVPDCRLRVSAVDIHHDRAGRDEEMRFCLSPSATRAVEKYFSAHTDPEVCLSRSQEVAWAIVQGKREWQSRRCSDPKFDDFDQMLFAEESYV
ncbi:rho GTPase-activating protein 20 isoform X1 [Paramormyrops kingsleyae]|uniref:rho GTPase-activating protein 20 isoform X1 n=1 Tax=Paramormyrops kingsleyae TaxID=1676925 RepID=UPI003B96D645